MSPELRQVLAQIAPFAVGVAILGVLMAVRPETRERLAWKPVPLGTLVRWLALWVVWVDGDRAPRRGARPAIPGPLDAARRSRSGSRSWASSSSRRCSRSGCSVASSSTCCSHGPARAPPSSGPRCSSRWRMASTARSTSSRSSSTGCCSASRDSGPARPASRSGCTCSGTPSRRGSVPALVIQRGREREVRRAQPPRRLVQRRVRLAEREPRHARRPRAVHVEGRERDGRHAHPGGEVAAECVVVGEATPGHVDAGEVGALGRPGHEARRVERLEQLRPPPRVLRLQLDEVRVREAAARRPPPAAAAWARRR